MKHRQIILYIVFSLLWISLKAQNITRPNITGPVGVSVNSYTGSMFYQRTDLFLGGRMPLNISFSYNSADRRRDQGFGKGWTFNYGMQVREDSASVVVIHSDGRKDVFKAGQGNVFISPAGVFDSLAKNNGTYILRTKEGIRYFFNDPLRKMLTRQEDRNGNALVFTYTDSLITGIADDAGRTIQLKPTNGRITTITEANGDPVRTIQYAYDDAGNLVKVTDPMGFTTQYSYLVNGPLNTVKDKNSNVVDIVYNGTFAVVEIISCLSRQTINYNAQTNTSFVTELVNGANQLTSYKFDATGNVIQKTGNCCGFNVQYEYDKDKNISKVIDANGTTYSFTYDSYSNLLSQTDPYGNSAIFSYEPVYNHVTKKIDRTGNTTSYSYDIHGNLVQVIKPLSITEKYTYTAKGDTASFTDGRDNTTSFNYDSYGNLTQIIRPLGSSTSYTFDAKSRKLTETDPLKHTKTYAYDALNRILKITDALNHSSTFSYDHNGNMIETTDASNHVTTDSYDAMDRVIKITNALGKSKNVSYDAKGNITAIKDENGNATSLTYDNLNRLISKTNAARESYSYSYDGNGNVISQTEPNGNILLFNYDKLNRLLNTKDNIGTVSMFTYDNLGNNLTQTDGNGNTITYFYDQLNRVVSITDALGHSSLQAYDENSNMISSTDKNNHITLHKYDALNRMLSNTDPLGFSTVFTYDIAGNLISVSDANSNNTTYSYDELNRRTSENSANGKSKTFLYDPVNNVIGKTDADGKSTNYRYDALNRLIKKDYVGSNNADVYTYDDGGRMLTSNNIDATLSFTYDVANRRSSEILNNRITGYNYNIPKNTETVSYPGGKVVMKTFDVRGGLKSISGKNSEIASFSYDNAERVRQISYPLSGSSENFSLDATGRAISIAGNPGSFLNFNYAFDPEGNKLYEKKGHDITHSDLFIYDNFNQLTQFKKGVLNGGAIPSPLTQTQFNFDGVGNRKNINQNGALFNYSVNSLNSYTSISGVSTITPVYDNNGNMIFDGTYSLTYDYNDQLVSASTSAGLVSKYKYDAQGRRIEKITGADTVNYFYDQLQIIEECNGANIVQATYVYGSSIDQVLTMDRGGNTYNYFYNNLGSVAAITDTTKKIVERYDYDPYGNFVTYNNTNQVLPKSISGNPFYFTGRQFDPEVNAYYYRARHLNPQFGRFLQRDPLGFVDGTNQYAYTNNNPANYLDPYGLWRLPDFITYQASFGIVSSISVSVTIDRYGNLYVAPGASVGIPTTISSNLGSASLTANWMIQPNTPSSQLPSEQTLNNYITQLNYSATAGIKGVVITGGWTPGSGNSLGIGIGTPGISGGYSWTYKIICTGLSW